MHGGPDAWWTIDGLREAKSQRKCSSWASRSQKFACGACNGYVTVRKRFVFVHRGGGSSSICRIANAHSWGPEAIFWKFNGRSRHSRRSAASVASASSARRCRDVASTISSAVLTGQLVAEPADEACSRRWLGRLTRSSRRAPPGHSLTGLAELASLRSESGRDRGYYRGVAEEHVLRCAPDEHGDRCRWR